MKTITEQTTIGEIRRVVLQFADSNRQEHFMHVDDVDAFVEATYKLHINPGINPHVQNWWVGRLTRADKRNTAPVINISVYRLCPGLTTDLWWSRPSLDKGEGATIISFDHLVWYKNYSEYHPDKTEAAAIAQAKQAKQATSGRPIHHTT